jgi:hypothetical protein
MSLILPKNLQRDIGEALTKLNFSMSFGDFYVAQATPAEAVRVTYDKRVASYESLSATFSGAPMIPRTRSIL